MIDNQALKYINSQGKPSHKHAKWALFFNAYTFVVQHRSGKTNVVVDTLSRRSFIDCNESWVGWL